nr:hypothetical protein [uncultured Mediterraneibacter sp.]
MYTIRNKIIPVLIAGILSGGILSFVFINPYDGRILVSEAILQLSGSSGAFPLTPAFKDLISFTIRMLPDYMFELYIGIELYRHFCTASVYVFSRTPNRSRWYIREVLEVAVAVFGYQIIKIFAAMSVTFLRYQIEPDHFGFFLLVFHIIVYSLWVFTVSLLINLISIKYGSNNAFIWIVGIQIFMTALLELVQIFESNLTLTKIFLNANPIAHLVIGWHTGTIEELKNPLEAAYIRLDFKVTLVTMLAISIFSVIVGIYLVSQHEFLIVNANEEGD